MHVYISQRLCYDRNTFPAFTPHRYLSSSSVLRYGLVSAPAAPRLRLPNQFYLMIYEKPCLPRPGLIVRSRRGAWKPSGEKYGGPHTLVTAVG